MLRNDHALILVLRNYHALVLFLEMITVSGLCLEMLGYMLLEKPLENIFKFRAWFKVTKRPFMYNKVLQNTN
jgi:hypothetical protein